MLKTLIATLVFVSLLGQPGQAQSIQDAGMQATCAPPYPVASTANTGAGFINFCVYYPHTVMPGSAFNVMSVLTAPTTVAPAFTAAINAFSATIGCTEGTPSNLVPTTNGITGTIITHITSFTMTANSEACLGSATASLTVAAIPLQIYIVGLPISILTENVRVDNFNYLCDAPGIAPTIYSTSGTTCNDPNINNNNNNNAISGSLTVSVCPEASPCFIESNSTLSINGNVSINQTNLPPEPKPGFDGSLYILVCIMIAVLVYLAQTREQGLYAFAGFLSLAAGFILYREMDRIGLTSLTLASIFTFLHLALAGYLFYLTAYEENPQEGDNDNQ